MQYLFSHWHIYTFNDRLFIIRNKEEGGIFLSITLVFFLILIPLFISTYLCFFFWKHLKIIKYIPALVGLFSTVLIFLLKRHTYGWEGLGFGVLQCILFLASCLTLVFASILETKSSMN